MPKKGSKKKKELEERQPPARGADAAEKIDALHAAAEKRHSTMREAKVRVAAQHNSKAAQLPLEVRVAQERKAGELKQSLDYDMRAHDARHEAEVHKVQIKGAHEVEKVHMALAKAEFEAEEEAAELAERQQRAMKAADERRAANLGRVAARGAAETLKVRSADAKLLMESEAKAAILDANASKAAERRAAKIGAIAAKGAAEGKKVERVVGHPLHVQDPSSPPPITRQAGSGKMRPAPPSPDSVLWDGGTVSTVSTVSTPPPPKPPTPTRPLEYGEANLLLVLMRSGAPNEEVLKANGPAELAAIATKYNIPLGQQQPAVCA